MIAEEVSQFMCWDEKSKVHKGGNIGRLNIVKGFTYSQILSWMNNVILALEISCSVFSKNSRQLEMSGNSSR
jgi:hypothetical protein